MDSQRHTRPTRVARGSDHRAGGGRADALAAWAEVLPPSGAFTHLAAAARFGWALPPRTRGLPVFAAQGAHDHRPRRAGLRVSRHRVPPPRTLVDGLPFTTPAETLLACARHLSCLDLVVLLDSALRAGACTRSDVEVAARARRRGAPALRRALLLADARSGSRTETLLRVLHVVVGVPVEPQHEVWDADGFVTRGHLRLRGTRVLHDVNGGARARRRRPIGHLAQARRLSAAGWVRRGYTATEVLTRGELILRDADAAIGREHRPERILAWDRLLAASLFTAAGQHELHARLGLARPARTRSRLCRGAVVTGRATVCVPRHRSVASTATDSGPTVSVRPRRCST